MTSSSADSQLAHAISRGNFVLTAEVVPPASADAAAMLERARPLRGLVDAVNVTDGARAQIRMSALAASAVLAGAGIEPVLQMTCRDRNRIALQSDLLGAWALGVRNVMVLRGDDPPPDRIPPASAVFDMDTAELVAAAERLRREGRLDTGEEVQPAPRMLIGAADLPVDPEPGWRPTGLMAKAEAGAVFAQTQFCFDLDVIRRYVARLAEFEQLAGRLALIVGIGPIASARSARWMRDNLFGTRIPDHVVDRMEAASDQRLEGIRICAELMEALSGIDGVAGAHLMSPVAGTAAIADAIRLSGLRPRPSPG